MKSSPPLLQGSIDRKIGFSNSISTALQYETRTLKQLPRRAVSPIDRLCVMFELSNSLHLTSAPPYYCQNISFVFNRYFIDSRSFGRLDVLIPTRQGRWYLDWSFSHAVDIYRCNNLITTYVKEYFSLLNYWSLFRSWEYQ